MKKLILPAIMYVIALMATALSVSAQNSDQNDEYRELLKKIMSVSGGSASSQHMISQFVSSVKMAQPQQDDAYWEEFAAKWLRKIEDKVLEVYVPFYQKNLSLDEMRKVVAFYESPIGKKLGQTTIAVAGEALPTMQQLGMEMVKEIMPMLQEPRNEVMDSVAEQKKKRDQAMFAAAYTIPKDSIKVADKTYQRGTSTMPILYSIERRKDDTKVTFLQPIYFDWQWLHFSRGFKIVDKKSGDEYNVRGYDGGIPFGKLLAVQGFDSKYIYVSLIFPKLKKSVKEIDILELPHENDILPSNDDGVSKSYFDVKLEDYQVTSRKTKKVYN